jgi:hypothetical protein
MALKDLLIKANKKEDNEPEWDSPDNSEWILGISDNGTVYVLSKPNIHESFFDNGDDAEMIGLPTEIEDKTGVYKCICSYHQTKDWESGHVDDWWFEIESMIPLWQQLEMPEMDNV